VPDRVRALLVIDMQVGMFNEADPVHDGGRLLGVVAGLLSRARAAGAPVVFVQHDGKAGSELAPGTPGHAIHPDVVPLGEETVVHKTRPDAFFATELDATLRRRGVRELVVCGIQTDLCVDTTCRRASSLGYDVIVTRDAHSTWPRLGLSAEQIIAHHNDILCDWFATGAAAADLF
jgi:nicotinamidase-related amidase